MAKKSSNNGNETRSKKLIGDYINFINDIDKDDIKANLTFDKLADLKSVISNINNIFTLLATRAVAGKIADAYKFEEEDRKKLFDQIEKTKANANGFDIRWEDPKILVEVKCNKPVSEDYFGAAQIAGIVSDIKKLYNGKKKDVGKTEGYIKIAAIVDFSSEKKKYNVGNMIQLIKNDAKKSEVGYSVTPIESIDSTLKSDCIYLYVISENALKEEMGPIIQEWEK